MAALATLKKMSTDQLMKRAMVFAKQYDAGVALDVAKYDRKALIDWVDDHENEESDPDLKTIEEHAIDGPPIEEQSVPITAPDHSSLSQVLAAKRAVDDAQIQHVEITMPLTMNTPEDDEYYISSENGHHFTIGRLGINYMAYRLKMLKESVQNALDDIDNLPSFIDDANDAWDTIPTHKRGKLIAAIVDGQLVGLMRNYTPVDHNAVIDAIAQAGLGEDMIKATVDDICLNMVLRIQAKGRYIVGLRIVNGHSGHVSFRYSATFMIDDFSYDIPLSDRTRHLSRVEDALANLHELVKDASELKIDETLRQTSMRLVNQIVLDKLPKPNKRQLTLLNNPATSEDCDSALDYIIKMSRYVSVSGYRKAAVSIINKIIEGAMEVK